MQTLNVGAGQSDAQYKEAEEQRRSDLRAESGECANFFFAAAGLAALGTGILPVRLNFIVSIGCIDLLAYYGRTLPAFAFVLYGVAGLWVAILVGLGLAARSAQRWAFLAGILLYAADAVALLVTFSIWAFAAHVVFIFKWFQGQKALKELHDAERARATAA